MLSVHLKEPRMSIAQSLLPEFQHELAGLRRVLERVPADRLDYRPHPKSFTLGALANHLAFIPGWVVGTLTETEMDFGLPETLARLPKPATTLEGILAALDRSAKDGEAALAKAADADFQVIWTLKNNGQALFAMPRIAVYRSFVMNHLVHHRAQLTVYLRMLEVPVPGLYGPSADEA